MSSRVIEIITSSFTKLLIPGLVYTIPITLISFAIGLLIAIVTALIRIKKIKVLSQIIQFYVWIFRGTPLLVQLFIIYYGLPSVGIVLEAFPAAIITFSLNVGAYSSETVRGAILSVDKRQLEACYSVGMTYFQSMYHIILPQALKIAIPPLFNSLIALVKDTSLAANITVAEMFMAAQRIVANTYEPLVLYIEVAIIYLAFSTILTYVQHFIERSLQISEV